MSWKKSHKSWANWCTSETVGSDRVIIKYDLHMLQCLPSKTEHTNPTTFLQNAIIKYCPSLPLSSAILSDWSLCWAASLKDDDSQSQNWTYYSYTSPNSVNTLAIEHNPLNVLLERRKWAHGNTPRNPIGATSSGSSELASICPAKSTGYRPSVWGFWIHVKPSTECS